MYPNLLKLCKNVGDQSSKDKEDSEASFNEADEEIIRVNSENQDVENKKYYESRFIIPSAGPSAGKELSITEQDREKDPNIDEKNKYSNLKSNILYKIKRGMCKFPCIVA